MRIAIVGAGAIGGMLGALLAKSGCDPLLVARGETLAKIRDGGIAFDEGDQRFTVAPRVTDDPAGHGHQDLVVIAVKAHQIEGALPAIQPLVGPKTRILTAINGVPWWFFQGIGGELDGRVLHRVDPTGTLARTFDPACIIGCAVYLAAEIQAPYTVVSAGVRKLVIGGASGDDTGFLTDVAELFETSGIPAPVTPNIRAEVMNKLMGNLWANPISVIIGGTMAELTADSNVRDVGRRMMAEFETLCSTGLGLTMPLSIDKRLEGAAKLGAFRTSMLQDIDRGRPIELEAILGAAIEIADMVGTPSETMRTVYALTKLKAELAGCYATPPGLKPLQQTGI
ncbi:MAG: 2-dehydropantoate 2-reductase [Alphaproteobacteria bacterium]|nr:2-dehydropantoate 2-reductase [Alphaproteobacteria bacterium]